MTGRSVALLRGINVGTAKSVSMAELASVFEGLGCGSVRTVLRSGNVVFDGLALTPDAIEKAVFEATAVRSSVIVLGAKHFRTIADANPIVDICTDGSKGFVTFLSEKPGRVETPDEADLAPEVLRVGADAVYQWMPAGSLQTKVPASFWRQFSGHVTARNLNTVQKLLAVLEA